MDRFSTGLTKPALNIAVLATFFMFQGCSPGVKSQESTSNLAQPNPAQLLADRDHHEHGGHSQPRGNEINTQAKLTIPKNIKTKTPVLLVIDIQDKNGKAIANFDIFKQQIMHLIVVSDDLQIFQHIHPKYQQNGRFTVQTIFPQSGRYTLFSDYKPAGKIEQVSVLKTQLPGKISSVPKIDLNLDKTFGDTQVNLSFSSPKLKAGKEVTLSFNLKQKSNNQPITDLQPVLGELGHLVILRKSSQLTKADYIHAHPLKNTPSGKVDFMATFPQPGKYKLWGQFNRNGKIVTADFWVNVEE